MKFECCHVDTCLPDYWSGHHLPYVQIPVTRGMSLSEIKDSIKAELRQGAVMGNTIDSKMLSWDFVGAENEALADRITRAAYAAVNRLKPAQKGQRKFFLDLDAVECDEDQVYAFFVFVQI